MPKAKRKADVGAVRIIRSISDNQSYQLFKTIASSQDTGSGQLMASSGLTRKQYYSRLSRLMSAGLIKKKAGKYGYTSMGRIIHRITAIIEYAADNQYKLKAVDSLELSEELPPEERASMIDRLLDNEEIKRLLSAARNSSQ
jgi:hypothetical protein